MAVLMGMIPLWWFVFSCEYYGGLMVVGLCHDDGRVVLRAM